MTLDKKQIEALIKLISASSTSHVYNSNRNTYDQLYKQLENQLVKLTV